MTRRRLRRWAWPRRATACVWIAVMILGRSPDFTEFKGATIAATLLEQLVLADPLAALEATVATRTWMPNIVLGAALLLAFAAWTGPVFCGWFCPLGLLLDLNSGIRRRAFEALGRKPATFTPRPPSVARYVVLGAVLGFSLVARWPVFQTVSPINLIAWALIFTAWPALFVVGGLMLVERVAPRLWCRCLCPLGALYSVVGRFGRLRIRINPDLAGQSPCLQCTIRCPMGIRVMEDYTLAGRSSVDHPECTRCGDCIDACPTGVLRLGFTTNSEF